MKSSGVDTEVLYLHIKGLSPRSFEFHFEAELLGGQWCALNALLWPRNPLKCMHKIAVTTVQVG